MIFKPLILLLCILPALLTEKGGAIGAINETMAKALLHYYYKNISEYIQNIDLDTFEEDGVTVRNGNLNISYFKENNVFFDFTSQHIKIKVNDIRGEFKGRAYKKVLLWTEARNFNVYINRADLEVSIFLKSKYDSNGNLIPDGQILKTTCEADFSVDIHGWFGDWFESSAKDKIKSRLNDKLLEKSKEFLAKGLSKIPMDIVLDSEKGLHLDLYLVRNIEMRPGFFTVDSYALLYNESYKDTHNKNRRPLTQLPYIEKIGNQFEILVSEYSINSALYTLYVSNHINSNVVLPISTATLEPILPGILEFYGKKNVAFNINFYSPTATITEDYLRIDAPALVLVRAEGVDRPFATLKSDISAEIELEIKNGVVKGRIVDFDFKIEQVYLNESKDKVPSETLVKLINDSKLGIIPKLNKYIPIEFNLPSIPGVSFTDMSVRTKDKYLLVNYNLSY